MIISSSLLSFIFSDTATTAIYTLSLHDALPISFEREAAARFIRQVVRPGDRLAVFEFSDAVTRSEEHTSELQSRGHLVCRLLLEKKKTKTSSKTPVHAPLSDSTVPAQQWHRGGP